MALVCLSVRPSICLSVRLTIHTSMVQHIEMPLALYDTAMLDVRSLCGS